MPNYQGDLDGLCGPYAIVNAFERCRFGDPDRVFRTACEALAPRRWPGVLWEGTTLSDLKRMIKRCRENINGADAIKTSYPFSTNTPNSNKDYWSRFDDIFDQKPNARCMILRITRPFNHWIVAHREAGTRISFTDTDPHKPYQRKNRSSLYAGIRNGNHNNWIIERSELILFEVE